MVARRYEIYLRVISIGFEHEKNLIYTSNYVVFFLLYKPTNYDVFNYFPKISEDFQNVVRRT